MTNEHNIENSYQSQQSENEAMRRKIGLELAHVMLRHEHGDIPEEVYNNFENRYVQSAMYHTSVIDPDAVRRELRHFAEEARNDAEEDIRQVEAEFGKLPVYKAPTELSSINIDNLLHTNLELSNTIGELETQNELKDKEIESLRERLKAADALSKHAVEETRRLGIEADGLRNQLRERQSQDMHAHIGWTE